MLTFYSDPWIRWEYIVLSPFSDKKKEKKDHTSIQYLFYTTVCHSVFVYVYWKERQYWSSYVLLSIKSWDMLHLIYISHMLLWGLFCIFCFFSFLFLEYTYLFDKLHKSLSKKNNFSMPSNRQKSQKHRRWHKCSSSLRNKYSRRKKILLQKRQHNVALDINKSSPLGRKMFVAIFNFKMNTDGIHCQVDALYYGKLFEKWIYFCSYCRLY